MANYIVDQHAKALLLSCSKKGDFSDWNEMRQKEKHKRIYLEGVDLQGLNLKKADLSFMHFSHALLNNCKLNNANLKRSWLNNAQLNNANLCGANLVDAIINGAQLNNTNLIEASLKGAYARYAVLNGANLHHARIQGTDFSYAIVNGETLIDTPHIDRRTLFTSVGLTSARLKSGLIDTLNYNIRKNRWEEWYEKGNIFNRISKKLFIRFFWRISDYGRSTMRIVLFFLSIAFIFALIYWFNPEIIQNMACASSLMKLYRISSFSLVTMITLGFGSMNADPSSFLGHFTVAFQIILGYVILAALVSRIAIMFDSDGPDLPLKKKYDKFSE